MDSTRRCRTSTRLDFSTRARLAGHRVVLVPTARVLSDGHPEDFGRKPGGHARRARLRRAAQLHRRLVYAPAVALPFHWLSLVPLALFRSIWQLLVKNPGAVVGEFRTAFGTAFGRSHIRQARVNFARTKKVPWRTLRPLRATFSDLRERRINERDAQLAGIEDSTEPRASFIGSGGLWITVLVAVVGWSRSSRSSARRPSPGRPAARQHQCVVALALGRIRLA